MVDYPHAITHPRCKVSCLGVPNNHASLLQPCFVKASPTIDKTVLGWKVDSSIVSLPSFCNIHHLHYMRISCCKEVTLKTRPQISYVLVSEVHQNDCSYVLNPGRPTVIGSLKFLTKCSQTCSKPKNLPKFTLFTWMMSGNMITHALINTYDKLVTVT